MIEQAIATKVVDPGIHVKKRFSPKIGLGELTVGNETKAQLKKPSFFEQIDDLILSKTRKVAPGTIGALQGMRGQLLALQIFRKRSIAFDQLDFNFYSDYVEFLTYDYQLKRLKNPTYGLKTATVGRTLKKLRMFVKDRIRRKIIQPIDLSEFTIVTEQTDAIYLSFEQIATIYNTDLSTHPHLVQCRDLFVLGCLTWLRFSNYISLKYEDVKKGMLYKKTQKVDSWMIVPLLDEAQQIFEAHFKDGCPKISNPKFNKLKR